MSMPLLIRLLCGLVLLFIISGCGENRAPLVSSSILPPPPHPTLTKAPLASPSFSEEKTASAHSLADTSDPLIPTEDALDGKATGTGQAATPDPLAAAAELSGEAKMPTKHSHWLRGDIHNARVTVWLNRQQLGVFFAPIDKDITMRLHPGANSISFLYASQATSSSADLKLLESEHTPPIDPLVTFQRSPYSEIGRKSSTPANRVTVFFIAN